ncbi:MAG TPA: hypothetical protein VGD60_13790 [Candidatus Acidoferrales bacterium]
MLWFRLTGVAVLASMIGGMAVTDGRLAELRARFSKEPDPVHRAKLLGPLADAEFHAIQDFVAAGNPNDAAPLASEAADEAEQTLKALDARGKDPEKHPEGYKHLEISVRGSLRRIENVIVELSADDQTPFLTVRKRLEDIEHQLLRDLFPHQPDEGPPHQPGSAPSPSAPRS